MAGRAVGANATFYAKLEAIYGTSPGGNFLALPIVSSDLGVEQPLEKSDVIGLGRDPQPPSRGPISSSGSVTMPIDLRSIGFWLALLTGQPTTTGAGPDYVHEFTGADLTLPSATIEVGHPEVPRYFQNFGCMVNSIKLPWSPSGKANATVAIIAQGQTDAAASVAGTPTAHALTRFQQSMGQVKKGGAALGNITGAELTISNGLDPVRVIRSDGKIEGCDLGVMDVSGQIKARFASMDILNDASSGTAISLSLGWEISATKSLFVSMPEVNLSRGKVPVSGPNGVEITFNFSASKPSSGTGTSCTVTLKNDVASYT